MNSETLISFLTALHVVVVVLWIGGVAFVTIIVFPMLLKMEDSLQKALMFQRIEGRFAKHARIYLILAGISGFSLLYLTGRFQDLFTTEGFGVTTMLIVWVFFGLVLTFEKKIFQRLFDRPEKIDPQKIFYRLSAFHWVVLVLSLLAVFAAVWEGH
ncbi:MAG: hypothetical protein GTO08_08735 [Deltaproteobacteria bacterium]|nr:hypothetical protein [Deltaproteobacteria bacterium]